MSILPRQLEDTLGAGSVREDPVELDYYSHDNSFTTPLSPQALVVPRNSEQVQELIAWANQTHTPLVPVSSGPPHFRGDTVPGVPSAVMVDLSQMNRIIRMDRRNRMAIVEAGVTYSQFLPELAKVGLTIPTPLLPRANKSVVAALLEREPCLIPRIQWAMLDPLRCLQIVWGDGVKMTTGEAESAGSLEEEWEKGYAQLIASGPQQTDFYKLASAAQGSMGIVTWASVRCQVLPEVHKLFFIASSKLEDLIDPLYRILRFRFGDELFIVNKWELASILAKSPEDISKLMVKLPEWVILVGLIGHTTLAAEKVDYQQRDIAEIAGQYGLSLKPEVPGASGEETLKVITSPSPEPYWKISYKGGCQDIFFLSTLERAPEFLKTVYSLSNQAGYPSDQVCVYIQPVHQGASCHIEFSFYYDPQNRQETDNMKSFYTRVSEELLKQGAYFSRPYGIWASMAFNEDTHTRDVLKQIKGIFDPNNIMNPGKLSF